MNSILSRIDGLLYKQSVLDEMILSDCVMEEGQSVLESAIVALNVELGEFANEWRKFKYWSKDKESRTFKWRGECEQCSGTGHFGPIPGTCTACSGTGDGHYNPMLEEYVDVLHFALSIHNRLTEGDEAVDFTNRHWVSSSSRQTVGSVIKRIILLYTLTDDTSRHSSGDYLVRLLELGEGVGFTADQVLEAYDEKYNINVNRQRNGY